MATTSPQNTLPTRSFSTPDEQDDAIPDEDSSEVTKLFHERLQAWKHACGYLEDYIQATEKLHTSNAKEYEKVLKTVSSPLRETHHFDEGLGGIAGLFENVRSNTQGLSKSHTETAKTLKGSVLPIFERLHTEIKNKTKELVKGAGKGAKSVDKARSSSQKHIEMLGQHTAAVSSGGSSGVKAHEDPYVLQRQIYHRLNKQVIDENNNRDDILAVQNQFVQFEAHIVQTLQNGVAQFEQVVNRQADQTRTMYTGVAGHAQGIAPHFEWNGFLKRNASVLIDPSAPKRTVENIGFANQDHPATRPLIAGSLERKGKLLKRYETGYYVVTPAKYLHEFKSDDDFAKDPTPENSLYLPDCLIGAVDGTKFNVKGKDLSKGTLGSKLAVSHEYVFKAHTAEDARKWHDTIASVAGQTTNELPDNDTAPNSPLIGGRSEEGIPTNANVASPTNPTVAAPHQSPAVGTAVTTDAAAPAGSTVLPATIIIHQQGAPESGATGRNADVV